MEKWGNNAQTLSLNIWAHVAFCQVVLVYQVYGHKLKYFLHHESKWKGLQNDLCIHLPKKALGQRGLSAHSPKRVGGDPQWRVSISSDAHLFRRMCTGVYPSQVKVLNTGQKNSHGEWQAWVADKSSLVGSVRCQTETLRHSQRTCRLGVKWWRMSDEERKVLGVYCNQR